jgi:hypothetical protein
MLEELQPLNLHDVAGKLGVHPFEVVRLLVMRGVMGDDFCLSSSTVDGLRSFAQIEDWWTEGTLPEDENVRRAVVRGVLDAMLQRNLISETTRLDNLWRGLPADSGEVAEQAVGIMLELGLLVALGATSGTRVSIHPDAVETIKSVVSRGLAPPEVAQVWLD